MLLDGLNPTNTFERKLLDVLVAMVTQGIPIPVQVTAADENQIGQSLGAVEARLSQMAAHVKQLEADYQQMGRALGEHSHDIIGMDDIKAQITELYRLVNGLHQLMGARAA